MQVRTSPALRVAGEVEQALAAGRPVVALESNVTANGLPRDRRLPAALEVEERVRAAGSIPATVAIIDGRMAVGLSPDEHRLLSNGARKVSARDIGSAVARGDLGATTISATIAIAERAGIHVTASAGLGGVHRGYVESLDVSPDLHQLVRSRSVVVCAGVKTVLDVPRTLEFLETRSIPVLGFRTSDFPAFYCSSSGLPCSDRFDDLQELARAIRVHHDVPGSGAVLVAHPLAEDVALDATEVESAIQSALREAESAGVRGPAVTNFLTRRVAEVTGGRAAAANEAVVMTIAGVGAQVAAALAHEDALLQGVR